MKYKKVSQILNYGRLHEGKRRKAVNFLIKRSIQKAELKNAEKLEADLRIDHNYKNMYKICNLFGSVITFESFSSNYSHPSNFDESLKRATIFTGIIERRIGHLDIKRLIGGGIMKISRDDSKSILAYKTSIKNELDGGLQILQG